MCGDAGAGLFALRRSLEQELSHPAGAQTLHQIKKRAVLEAPAAAAVLLAARQVLPDIGGTHQIGRRLKPGQQRGLTLLQGGNGLIANDCCLSHIYR